MHRSTLFRVTLCCMALASTGQAQSQLEGTLFTSPAEREYLDYLRDEFVRDNANAGFYIEEAIPTIPQVAPPVAAPIEYSFGGIMTRRDGMRSIWLNGALYAEADLPAGFQLVEVAGVLSLRIAMNSGAVTLKPGQSVDLSSGAVIENFQRVPVSGESSLINSAETEPMEELQSSAQLVAPQIAADAQVAAPASEPEEGSDTTENDLMSLVSELDDTEAEALADALELRMLERAPADEDVDEN